MKIIKKILFLLCMCFGLIAQAQTVGYTYKALAAEGCNMKYNEPTMKMKTFTGEYLELKGKVIGDRSQSAGLISGNIVIPVTKITSTAQFKITPQQLEVLNEGVAKIRLSMTPMNHERTFQKDKIGKKLYQFYLKEKKKDEDF